MPKDPNEIGALWLQKSAGGTTYMSGKINGQQVVVFKNNKKTTDKHPDYRVLISTPKEKAKPEPESDFG